jgi:hypothetical protein
VRNLELEQNWNHHAGKEDVHTYHIPGHRVPNLEYEICPRTITWKRSPTKRTAPIQRPDAMVRNLGGIICTAFVTPVFKSLCSKCPSLVDNWPWSETLIGRDKYMVEEQDISILIM